MYFEDIMFHPLLFVFRSKEESNLNLRWNHRKLLQDLVQEHLFHVIKFLLVVVCLNLFHNLLIILLFVLNDHVTSRSESWLVILVIIRKEISPQFFGIKFEWYVVVVVWPRNDQLMVQLPKKVCLGEYHHQY